MKKFIYILLFLSLLCGSVTATTFSNDGIPTEAETYIVNDPSTFWEDLWYVIHSALKDVRPEAVRTTSICLKLICITILGSILYHFAAEARFVTQLVTSMSTGLLLLDSGFSLIELGKNTVQQISDYGKILLPVLTGALATQGAVTTSTVLYTGTALFSAVLNDMASKLLIPFVYLYLCTSLANNVLLEEFLGRIRDFMKWLITWSLKTILYLFSGYMAISGVISGTVDASALKITKLAISGAVPVVGKMLSDASETILLGADVMKNSVGAYGLIVLVSLLVSPFLKIAVHYLLMKITAAVCVGLSMKEMNGFLEDYSSAMGYILAMTGISCLLLMVGIVCMMKGVV